MAREIYRLDEESVKDIVRWALTAQLPKEIYLDSEYITDVRECIRASIRNINPHYPDPSYNCTTVKPKIRGNELVNIITLFE